MDSLWVLFHVFLLYSQPVGSKVMMYTLYTIPGPIFSSWVRQSETVKRPSMEHSSRTAALLDLPKTPGLVRNHQESCCKLTKNTATEMDEKHHFHTCSRGGWWCVPVKDLHPPNHPSLDLQALQAAMDSKLQGGRKNWGVHARVNSRHSSVSRDQSKMVFFQFCEFWYVIKINYSGWWFGTFLVFPYIGNVLIPTDTYFSEGLKPPTRWSRLIKRVW